MASPNTGWRRGRVIALSLASAVVVGGLVGLTPHPWAGAAVGGAQPVGTAASSWLERGEPFVRPGKLDAGDVVRVTVFGLYTPGGHDAFDLHVDPDGAVTVPLVNAVPVRGMTTDRAAAAISAAQGRAGLQTDAIVTVGLVRKAAETKVRPGPMAAGDNLRITLFDITGPSNRLEVLSQVADDGTVTLPLVGAVKVVELTEATASETVSKAFQQKGIIENATVSVLKLDPAGLP